MSVQLELAGFPQALIYKASDIPRNMTLRQWRLERRATARRTRRLRRFVRVWRRDRTR
jgi:hypothetical protein